MTDFLLCAIQSDLCFLRVETSEVDLNFRTVGNNNAYRIFSWRLIVGIL